ncbi:MAG: DUF6600 domain-containing protein [Bryobacteraceae bacterium]
MNRAIWMLWLSGVLLSSLGWAQDETTERGVARISLMRGDVAVRRGDSGDAVEAAVNSPLVVFDGLVTGPGARAEIEFDHANLLRLSSDTEIRISALAEQRYQVQVARGTVTLAVVRESHADMEVDTPNVSVRPVGQGSYRIAVTSEGQTEVTVRAGEAEAFTPQGSERIPAGSKMMLRGPATDPEFQMVAASAPDAWDQWNQDRDRSLVRSPSYQYVSPDVPGAEDLDSSGRWINVPPYGWVWSPNGQGPDWAPYRDGRWVWIDWYGWTWVDYSPWGWAPYHYGRWFYGASYGWCWFPGPIYERYHWRPALVAFFGFGGGAGMGIGFGFGFGFGAMGWVPLAPYEPFYPWYGRGYYGAYSRTSAMLTSVNVGSVYRNARFGNGVSGIASADFVRGRAGHAMTVGQASVVRGPVPVTPTAESLRLSDRPVRMATANRSLPASFMARRQAPAVQRIPFDQQRRGMEQVAQRSFSSGNAGTQIQSGWRQIGQPASPGVNQGSSWRQIGAAPNRTTESIRINPPIVRARTAPQSVVYRGSTGGASRPAASAPRTNSSGGGSHTPSGAPSRAGDAHR